MPDDEGLALHHAGVEGGRVGPLLEVGTYCGKSAVYLGAAARATARCASRSTTTAVRRRTRRGGSTTTPRSSIPRPGRMDTLPFFRRTIQRGRPRRRRRRDRRLFGADRTRVADAARVAVHRRRPRRGRRDWPTMRAGRLTSRPAACSRSTTCSRTRPTADRRRSTYGSARSPTDSRRWRPRARCACSVARGKPDPSARAQRAPDRARGLDLGAGFDELLGGEARGQALAAEQPGRRAAAAERVGREHHGRAVPRRLLGGEVVARARRSARRRSSCRSSSCRRRGGGTAPTRTASRARSCSPIASSAITSSHVSAAVTHGWSETQRTPRPGTTNVSHFDAMRASAAWPRSTPAEDRVVPVHRPAFLVEEALGPVRDRDGERAERQLPVGPLATEPLGGRDRAAQRRVDARRAGEQRALAVDALRDRRPTRSRRSGAGGRARSRSRARRRGTSLRGTRCRRVQR